MGRKPPTTTTETPASPQQGEALRGDSFLGLGPEDQAPYEQCRVVLIRAPYEGTVSYGGGASQGPAAIFAASCQVELLDLEREREPWEVGVFTPPPLEPSTGGPDAMVELVERHCAGPQSHGKLVFTLGGEHTVTVGAARAAAAVHGEISFLQIDAHLDLRESYQGERHSHACTARRLLELGRVTAVGPRVGCPEELQVIREHGLAPVWGHELPGLADGELIRRVLEQLGPRVYVTLDVDGLDPSVIRATGTPVPGGLGWYQVLALLRAVGAERQVVGCDLVELAPDPEDRASDFAAALLVYKMIGYFTE